MQCPSENTQSQGKHHEQKKCKNKEEQEREVENQIEAGILKVEYSPKTREARQQPAEQTIDAHESENGLVQP